jgi:hypothetical protein
VVREAPSVGPAELKSMNPATWVVLAAGLLVIEGSN